MSGVDWSAAMRESEPPNHEGEAVEMRLVGHPLAWDGLDANGIPNRRCLTCGVRTGDGVRCKHLEAHQVLRVDSYNVAHTRCTDCGNNWGLREVSDEVAAKIRAEADRLEVRP